MKRNSEDIQTYVSDLNSWMKDVSKQDKDKNIRDKKKGNKNSSAAQVPGIRNRVELDQHKMRKQQAIFEKEDIKKNSKMVK